MKRTYTKLLLTLTALVVSLVMVVSVSYAWMTLANNPVAEGIQITIGGGNTILVAPDLSREADGTVYHYPGVFEDTLNFSRSESYAYLGKLSDLTPVSTADGVNWFLPTYYDVMDPEVQAGTVLSGTQKSFDQFILDSTLSHANLSSEQEKQARGGSYLYLDFWVVSPGDDYTLRLSTGDGFGGSYVVGLPQAVRSGEGCALSDAGNGAAACVRVGMLADPGYITDNNAMLYYQNSGGYNTQYHRLRGSYAEPGAGAAESTQYRFTIYEPNGDAHPAYENADGDYWITQPLGLVDGAAVPVTAGGNLTVQTQSSWAAAQLGQGTQLEQRFQTALFEPSFQGLSDEEVTAKFYADYLGFQLSPYVSTGKFIKNTQNLYNSASSGVVDAAFLGENYTAGATDDAYIVKLERNVPQRIRMFIWLEGQDADCVNSAEASSLALCIELAGSNQNVESRPASGLSENSGVTDENESAQSDGTEAVHEEENNVQTDDTDTQEEAVNQTESENEEEYEQS